MSQVKIYGVRERLLSIRNQLSEVIHGCVVEALQFPENKRAHRFFIMLFVKTGGPVFMGIYIRTAW